MKAKKKLQEIVVKEPTPPPPPPPPPREPTPEPEQVADAEPEPELMPDLDDFEPFAFAFEQHEEDDTPQRQPAPEIAVVAPPLAPEEEIDAFQFALDDDLPTPKDSGHLSPAFGMAFGSLNEGSYRGASPAGSVSEGSVARKKKKTSSLVEVDSNGSPRVVQVGFMDLWKMGKDAKKKEKEKEKLKLRDENQHSTLYFKEKPESGSATSAKAMKIPKAPKRSVTMDESSKLYKIQSYFTVFFFC